MGIGKLLNNMLVTPGIHQIATSGDQTHYFITQTSLHSYL